MHKIEREGLGEGGERNRKNHQLGTKELIVAKRNGDSQKPNVVDRFAKRARRRAKSGQKTHNERERRRAMKKTAVAHTASKADEKEGKIAASTQSEIKYRKEKAVPLPGNDMEGN